MNIQQFITKWCEFDDIEEMEADLKLLIKNEIEEKEAWQFNE